MTQCFQCLFAEICVSEGYKKEEQCKNFRPKKDSAEWKINPDGYYPYCSACHQEPASGIMTIFCPSCGCIMRGNEFE